ncbi:MAG TPA: ribosome small subunit-dependent GTPase A [Xanthomonadaceae bacterium]|nr:ribosome small subunit-dependent GTPase A [Xanthomonadaceae bacterium]
MSSSDERLRNIGWKPENGDGAAAGDIARVVEQHRASYRVHDGEHLFAARLPASSSRLDAEARPAVGDWVRLDRTASPPLIVDILPRRSVLKRSAAGERFDTQLIATNIDTAFVVCGLDGDFNPRRIERYLLLIDGSGIRPVVVLTKADSCDDVKARVAEVQAVAGDAAVVAINARHADSAAVLAPWLGEGESAVLVGSSGAGKSTLTNTLLGQEYQATGAVRDNDSRGRHTTTYRSLIPLPGGACLIDTPGMRELKLTGEEDLGDIPAFADIETLAGGCRFRDCQHGREPGCAIQAAIAAGELDEDRWRSYLKLAAEIENAREARALDIARKAEERVLTKALRTRLRDKYGADR